MIAVQHHIGAALERAYAAFAREPRPTRLIVSPLRDAGKILETLTAAPLRALTCDQIGPYSSWAITTVGDARDYRHFLPRILELAVSDPTWLGAEPAVIASKLKLGDWSAWGSEQRAAVIGVFEAAMEAAPASDVGIGLDAEAWLCGLTTLDIAPEPWLARWSAAPLPAAACQIVQLVTVAVARDGSVSDGFWEEVDPVPRATIAAWLASPATRDQLIVARAMIPEEDRWEIDMAIEKLGIA